MSIGEALTQARQRAGLTVAQVSQQTRIRATIIAGIEGDDYSACGGDFYARGHIRAIARAIGTDPEPLIREYDEQQAPPPDEEEAYAPPETGWRLRRSSRRDRDASRQAWAEMRPDREFSLDDWQSVRRVPPGAPPRPHDPYQTRPDPYPTRRDQPVLPAPTAPPAPPAEDEVDEAPREGPWPASPGHGPRPEEETAQLDEEPARPEETPRPSLTLGEGAGEPEPDRGTDREAGGPGGPASRRDWDADQERMRRPVMTIGFWLALVIVGGLVIFHFAGRSSHSSPAAQRRPHASSHPPTSTPPPTSSPSPVAQAAVPLRPASATSFGVGGPGQGDNSYLASQAFDASIATAWQTDWYTTPDFGHLYKGTGMMLDMGKPVTIASARILLGAARGAALQLRVGSAPTLAALRPAATATGVGGLVKMTLATPATGRYVLIWFTRLPPDPAGTFREWVYNVRLAGRP